MTNRKYFKNQFGRGSVTFICAICDRRTRDTGQGVDHLCYECYEICGLDNTVNDDGSNINDVENKNIKEECERNLAKIIKLGGNGEKVKKQNRFIWPKA